MMQRQKRNGPGLRTVRGKEATEEAEARKEHLENVEDAREDENSLSASGSSYRSPGGGREWNLRAQKICLDEFQATE
jgi:hypothetical protein